MSAVELRALSVQSRYAIVASLRNPRLMFFGVAFPVFLLVLFNSIFTSGADATTSHDGGTMSTKAYFTAGLAAYAIALQTFTQIVIAVTAERESGQLKRLRGTPMPAWTFIVAYLARSVVLVAAVVLVLFAIGGVFFGVSYDAGSIVGIAGYTLVGTATLAALGMAMTVFTPTVDTASAVGPFTVVILSFVSGVFLPTEDLPDWLREAAQFFPLEPLASGLQRSVAGTSGTGLVLEDLVPLVIWLVVGVAIAVRRFRWEPLGR